MPQIIQLLSGRMRTSGNHSGKQWKWPVNTQTHTQRKSWKEFICRWDKPAPVGKPSLESPSPAPTGIFSGAQWSAEFCPIQGVPFSKVFNQPYLSSNLSVSYLPSKLCAFYLSCQTEEISANDFSESSHLSQCSSSPSIGGRGAYPASLHPLSPEGPPAPLPWPEHEGSNPCWCVFLFRASRLNCAEEKWCRF